MVKETDKSQSWALRRTFLVIGAIGLGLLLLMLVPSTVRSSDMEQGILEGWQTILSEDFEGGLGAGWTAVDESSTDGGEYTWGPSNYPYTDPITAVWSVGGGAEGSSLVAGTDSYPDNVDSWLIYGPVDLSEVWQADLTFDWWLDSAPGDWFGWCTMTDISDLSAGCEETRISGGISTWISGTISLDAYARTSHPVYLAFHFTSDGDGNAGEGAFVDNVMVRGDYGQRLFLPVVRRDPTPTPPGYDTGFGGSTTWEVVEHTGDDGPSGTDWFDVRNESGYLKMWVADRWEHIIASPRESTNSSSYEIETRIYFEERSWSSGYGIVFGSTREDFRGEYYRIIATYISDGKMQCQLARCTGSDCNGPTLWGWTEVSKNILNGQQWNDWRIVRDGDDIRVYINNHLVMDVEDDGLSGKGYFGLFASTWEFEPIEVWVDYYNVE